MKLSMMEAKMALSMMVSVIQGKFLEDGYNHLDNNSHDDIDGDGYVDDGEGYVDIEDGDEGDREELVGGRGRRRLHLLPHVRSLLWTLYI